MGKVFQFCVFWYNRAVVLQVISFRDRFALPAALDGAGCIDGKVAPLEARRMDAYALVYLTAGGGFFRDPAGERDVAAGDLLLLFPDLVHGYGPRSGGTWSERFLVFHGPVFAQLETDGILDRRQGVWHLGGDPLWREAFDDLAGRFHAPAIDQAWCVARIHLLIVEAARRAAHRDGDFIAAASAALAEDEACLRPLAAIAADFGLSEQVFRKRFAERVGIPPARWRQRRRIERAKHLLLTGDDPLATIADRLGWCDQFFFARQFKQATGQAPGAFRRAFRGR